MPTKETDLINVFLIIFSLFLAFQYPFELFFFSFIVLGPLHYLTEINWLKEKNYFVQNRHTVWLFVLITVIISIPFFQKIEIIRDFFQSTGYQPILKWVNRQFGYLILFGLLFSIALVHFSSWFKLMMFFIVAAGLSFVLLNYNKTLFMIATFLITTIIHVYLFTLLFMYFGYTKNKTFYGKLNIILLLVCPLLIMISTSPLSESYQLSPYIVGAVYDSGIGELVYRIAQLLNIHTYGTLDLSTPKAVKIMTFISFAYTYHYLNWFSKTSIIGWSRNLTKQKTYAILLIWIGIIILYKYNFNYGLVLLFFFSTLHVLLEFPLNITTMRALVQKVPNR